MACNIDTGVFVGVMSIFALIIFWIFTRMDNDIRALSNKIDSTSKFLGDKIEAEIKSLEEDKKAQTARTDQLYQMFIDLLKSQKNLKTDP